jgi:hypothetical protein
MPKGPRNIFDLSAFVLKNARERLKLFKFFICLCFPHIFAWDCGFDGEGAVFLCLRTYRAISSCSWAW